MTPDEYTNKEFFIGVGNGHKLYVYDWGNPKGLPIIFLHGGPGSGVKNKHKLPFNASRHHVIFFDQRGSGQSLPYGSLKHNTTDDLISDITKIADRVKFKKFVLYGGSWGSCLALAYAIKHPERTKALVIHGVWTCSKEENEWLTKGKFRTFFPDAWDKYLGATPKQYHKDPTAYHFKQILGGDDIAAAKSAYAYDTLQGNVYGLNDIFMPSDPAEYDPSGMRVEVHYTANDGFMTDRHILNNAHKLKMPVWIVQGRYDMVCPPATAYELSQKLKDSNLVWTISNHKGEHEDLTVMRAILLQLAEKG